MWTGTEKWIQMAHGDVDDDDDDDDDDDESCGGSGSGVGGGFLCQGDYRTWL